MLANDELQMYETKFFVHILPGLGNPLKNDHVVYTQGIDLGLVSVASLVRVIGSFQFYRTEIDRIYDAQCDGKVFLILHGEEGATLKQKEQHCLGGSFAEACSRYTCLKEGSLEVEQHLYK